MFQFEQKYLLNGCNTIAGVDEAGRGPLAGPVVCACVIMPLGEKFIIEGVNDSKKLSPAKREYLYEKIVDTAIDFKISIIDNQVIDEINIYQATRRGMEECITGIGRCPDIVLIDAMKGLNVAAQCESVIHGDALSYSIAAASIIAKVTRDRMMVEYHQQYPEYNFAKHKGYGTREHVEILQRIGKCDLHRNTFIKKFVDMEK